MTQTRSAQEVDETLQLLANHNRRKLLQHLLSHEKDLVTVPELVEILETQLEPRAISDGGDGRVETRLHHVHLPKLADAGVITFDRTNGTVTYQGDQLVESLLAAIESSQ